MLKVDPKALRDELRLADPADIRSMPFLRFVMRLSEALDVDVAPHDYPRLATVASSVEFVRRHVR